MKRIIAVFPDFSIFVYHYNDLCLEICKSRLKKGEIAAYQAIEITEQVNPAPNAISTDKPLTECMAGRDAECNHPRCPITDKDVRNGKYCTLPLYEYRE